MFDGLPRFRSYLEPLHTGVPLSSPLDGELSVSQDFTSRLNVQVIRTSPWGPDDAGHWIGLSAPRLNNRLSSRHFLPARL